LMALCTSSFEAETPRAIYRLSADINSKIFGGKVNLFGEIIWKARCFSPDRAPNPVWANARKGSFCSASYTRNQQSLVTALTQTRDRTGEGPSSIR